LSLATGVAVVDAVSPLIEGSGVEAGLKWPNDVLAGGGKLAGILAEVATPVVVIGVGLNVTQAPEEVAGATSLHDLGVAAPDRDQLVCSLLRELGGRIVQWRGADPRLAADYRSRSLTIGTRVSAQLPGGREIIGTARDIDDQGGLCLETDGKTVVISAGDIVHLR
jgi:BirA family biotin operon repressor/biotin-[acetyl-CoA-carboxylase] ligase